MDIRIKTREEGPLALIMAPTRELAKQIQEETMKLAQYCYEPRLEGYRDPHIKAVCIVGGESITQQSSLTTNGCDILIGTPGRLLDCLDHHYITLNQTNYIVLDEADRMIDEGFEDRRPVISGSTDMSNVKLCCVVCWMKETYAT